MRTDQLPALKAARASGKIAYFNSKLVIKDRVTSATSVSTPASDGNATNNEATAVNPLDAIQHPSQDTISALTLRRARLLLRIGESQE